MVERNKILVNMYRSIIKILSFNLIIQYIDEKIFIKTTISLDNVMHSIY